MVDTRRSVLPMRRHSPALSLAGEPVNNRRLAELMGVSPAEAFGRVAQLEGAIRKVTVGISLH